MNSFDDEKLKHFLKRNAPVPPPAPRNELQTLMTRLGLKETSRFSFGFPWLAFGGFGALTAGFVAGLLVAQPPTFEQMSPQAEFKTGSALQAMVFDKDFDPEEGDEADFLPTEEVGEEFLGLIATNEIR